MENQNIVVEKQPMKNKNMILWVKPGTEFWGDIRVKGDVFVDDRCCIHGKIVADNVYFGSGITASNIYAKGYFFCKNGNFFGNVTAKSWARIGKRNVFKNLSTEEDAVIGKCSSFKMLIAKGNIYAGDAVEAFSLEAEGEIKLSGNCYVICVYSDRDIYIGINSTVKEVFADSFVKLDVNATAERITTFGSVIMSDTATVYESIGAQNVKKVEFDKPEGKIFTIEKEPNGKTTSANI